ncbi:MAG TPA: 23S rRNA (guanosine(2251)-2'-O)-methyltransferase RlmB [Solirubrobacteraceae bacterium]|jgi:23S rRNA (guanosine2251-2'-O)-methyltransferase|nr:23S rRNA (guanosine(2251)-2'-O)-methyltransferase RlmB [Solirubrobacteraceae bacterium]
MIVYGRNPVRELLRGRRRHAVTHVVATESVSREPWLRAVPIELAGAEAIERACGSSDHQGVCADAGPYPYSGAEEILAGPDPLIVALDELQDPHNLGAIARTAECAGASGVVICERRAAEVSPAVCKASAGAVEHLRIARVRNMVAFLERAQEVGFWCHGAASGGGVAYDAPDYSGGVVLVLGGEGRGLRRLVAERCDDLVSLPLIGKVGSLNVSAAAAVLVYEVLQQRALLDTET